MTDTEDSDQDLRLEDESRRFWGSTSPATVVGTEGIKMQGTPNRKQNNFGELKSPWVPAPAKTSSQTNIIFSRKNRYSLPAARTVDSNSEMKITDMPVPTPQTSTSSISDSGFGVSRPLPSKVSSSHDMSRHRLQSKDSFIDVTACLSRKRNRIMKLWEDSISSTSTNSNLLERLENANKFGQQAAAQLEKLKSVSAEINKGYATDAESVESLRELVMQSLRKFENENKAIQTILSKNHEGQELMIPVECSPAADEDRRLEEKIADQHQTIKSLESELKRVESQCTFDFRLLKSNMSEKLDDLNGFPELLHITEMKLAQCMSRNAVLEKTVQDKDNENGQLRIEVNSNRSKVDSLTEKLRFVECENAQLKGRVKELEEFSLSFKQGNSTESILKAIESKLEFLKTDTASSKIQDLEEKLRLSKKHIQHQKRAKEDVTNRLTRRVEELMEALDESRQKNHILRNQLRLIRSSYHKLFPTDDLFGLEDHPDDDKPLAAD
ncbi:unnamed protein product [Allacma fusca]|uniref:Uncharacterized protein n=1 Tax=Allacma fusca TaxID=39272 RepID=A0A8J2Q3J9_9HEXA|nr:unnamed protein product [Allacma fusca]